MSLLVAMDRAMAADVAFIAVCIVSLLANANFVLSYYKSRPPSQVGLVGLVNRDLVLSYTLATFVSNMLGNVVMALNLVPVPDMAAQALAFPQHFLIQAFMLYLFMAVVVQYAHVCFKTTSLTYEFTDEGMLTLVRLGVGICSFTLTFMLALDECGLRIASLLTGQDEECLKGLRINAIISSFSMLTNIVLRSLMILEGKKHLHKVNKATKEDLLFLMVLSVVVIVTLFVANAVKLSGLDKSTNNAGFRVIYVCVNGLVLPCSYTLSHRDIRRHAALKLRAYLSAILNLLEKVGSAAQYLIDKLEPVVPDDDPFD